MTPPFDKATSEPERSPVQRTTAIASGLSGAALRRVIEHVDTHLHEAITVRRLAEIARLSVPYFSRAFSRSTGLSPHRYLVRQRIERARRLLLETERASSEIALLAGFSDQSHFIRCFVRLTGLTPHAFRRQSNQSRACSRQGTFVQSRTSDRHE